MDVIESRAAIPLISLYQQLLIICHLRSSQKGPQLSIGTVIIYGSETPTSIALMEMLGTHFHPHNGSNVFKTRHVFISIPYATNEDIYFILCFMCFSNYLSQYAPTRIHYFISFIFSCFIWIEIKCTKYVNL